VGAVLLFGASMGGTLLVVWPSGNQASARGADADMSDQQSLAVQSAPVVPDVHVGRQVTDPAGQLALPEDGDLTGDDEFDAIPDRLAGMYAEPALLDLLEDADSSDPQVSEEARRVLREHEMLPAEVGASTSAAE
jgi:hypothetical protein